MKKIFYIALVLVALMVIGRLLNRKPIENATVEYQATIEKQPIVKEDANGNMTVDGEIVEDIVVDPGEDGRRAGGELLEDRRVDVIVGNRFGFAVDDDVIFRVDHGDFLRRDLNLIAQDDPGHVRGVAAALHADVVVPVEIADTSLFNNQGALHRARNLERNRENRLDHRWNVVGNREHRGSASNAGCPVTCHHHVLVEMELKGSAHTNLAIHLRDRLHKDGLCRVHGSNDVVRKTIKRHLVLSKDRTLGNGNGIGLGELQLRNKSQSGSLDHGVLDIIRIGQNKHKDSEQ